MNWSTDGQTPEFLAATRMISLSDSIVATILSQLNLKPDMHVLDVGCGSGEYCFRLGSATQGVHYTGLEIDSAFVDFANQRAIGAIGYPFEEPNSANDYHFVCGNGLNLPFEDNSFDVVISHTYLTALPDWACALAEMCRVCKPGGIVSSVTSMTNDFYGTGTIALFTRLFDPMYAEILQLVEQAKHAIGKPMNLTSGIPPRKVPVSFEWMGLEGITGTPLAQYACLSDVATTDEFRKRYVDLLYNMELKQLERLKANPVARTFLTDEQWEMYEALLLYRRNELAESKQDHEWNWYGNASLLVCGKVPCRNNAELDKRWHEFRDKNSEAQKVLQSCINAGTIKEVDTTQLGPGRCVKSIFTLSGNTKLTVCGFDPPRTLLEGCAKASKTNETNYTHIEGKVLTTYEDLSAFPALPNADIYKIEAMWEAVSEAALSGISMQFKDAGTYDDCSIVICTATEANQETTALSAHSDLDEAIMRAFARAIGQLQALN